MTGIKTFLKNTLLTSAITLGTLLNTNAQNYDLTFKLRELTNETGKNISNVKIDIDYGSYIAFTNSNGEATIPQIIPGNHYITISKEGYLEFVHKNYQLNSNQTFNASIPKVIQVGPWGTTTLNADWLREANGIYNANYDNTTDNNPRYWRPINKDPPQWNPIIPIPNTILNASKNDSALVLESIAALEKNTGYDLIDIVNSSNNNFVINMNSNTNISSITTNSITIFEGYSLIAPTDKIKNVIHEIIRQFGIYPLRGSSPMYPSVMDSIETTRTDPQPYDYMHIALNINENLAKSRGEQELFLGNMHNYVSIMPTQTWIIYPIDNSINLDNAVRLAWTAVTDADKYRVQIATDPDFTKIYKDFNAQRRDTIVTFNSNNKYYMRLRAENKLGVADWTEVSKFSTRTEIINSSEFITPINNSTNVTTAVPFTWTPSTANNYNLEIATDTTFTNLVKDVDVSKTDTVIVLDGNRKYFARVQGKTPTAVSDWSSIVFKTINHAPSSFEFIKPTMDEIITFDKGKLAIETTVPTDVDNDSLTKKIRVQGTGLDTLIITPADLNSVYLDSTKLKSNTEYTLNGEVTDGKLVTQASNNVRFKTPIYVGTNELLDNLNLLVYPTLVKDYITIDVNKQTTLNIEVRDLVGRLQKQYQENISGTVQLDVNELKGGMYILDLESKDNTGHIEHKVMKIIKQ
jgi:hypothetical protein